MRRLIASKTQRPCGEALISNADNVGVLDSFFVTSRFHQRPHSHPPMVVFSKAKREIAFGVEAPTGEPREGKSVKD